MRLINDHERHERARTGIGAADEYRRLVAPGGALSGLCEPALVRRILSPKWTGRRFWIADGDSGRRHGLPMVQTIGARR